MFIRETVLAIVFLFFVDLSYGQTASHDEKRSVTLVPVASFFLPGLGSFLEEDYSKGAKFLGYFGAGLGVLLSTEQRIKEFNKSDSLNFHHYRDLQREQDIGRAMAAHSMMFSLYDSFLSRVEDHKSDGKYLFLPKDQTINSVLKAPIKFEYMKRWTTYVPFSLALILSPLQFNKSPRPDRFELRPVDGVSSTYMSYVAGTGEEAMFRGWMYPVLYQNTDNHFLSNAIQGTVFGYMHGPKPYFQLAFGFYAGWLTKRNEFDIGEAAFVHAWWDFWLIAAEFARSRSFTEDFNIQLPPLQF